MIALILAAGEAVRWQGGRLKQLMPIGDETVLERIMRQAEAHAEVLVVSHEPDIQAASGGRYYEPPDHRWLVETLLSSVGLWDRERTVILLGDVIYTDEAMVSIMDYEGPLAVFGSRAELFALNFSGASAIRVRAVLGQALMDAHHGGLGKLWQFYRALCGFPLYTAWFEDQVFVHIDDGTDDIDTLEEYRAFCERMPEVFV